MLPAARSSSASGSAAESFPSGRFECLGERQRSHRAPRAGRDPGALVDHHVAPPEQLGDHRRARGVALEHGLGRRRAAELVVRAVGVCRVQSVGGVVPREFPVAAVLERERARQHAQPPAGMPFDVLVEIAGRRAEPRVERLGLLGERAEHEAAVGGDGEAAEVERRPVELDVVAGVGDRHQSSVVGVRPAVVGAREPLRASLLGDLDGGAAVRAPVQQGVNPAVAVAGDEDRSPADADLPEVAAGRHLALVEQEHPGAAEQVLHLQVEDRGVGVQPPVHPAGLDQAVEVDVVTHRTTPGCGTAAVSSGMQITLMRRTRMPAPFAGASTWNW